MWTQSAIHWQWTSGREGWDIKQTSSTQQTCAYNMQPSGYCTTGREGRDVNRTNLIQQMWAQSVQSIHNGQVGGKGGISNKPAQLNRLALTKCNTVGIAQLAGKEGMWIEPTWSNRCERKVQSIHNGQVWGKGGISNKPAQLNRLALTKCNPVGIAQLAGKEGMWIETIVLTNLASQLSSGLFCSAFSAWTCRGTRIPG